MNKITEREIVGKRFSGGFFTVARSTEPDPIPKHFRRIYFSIALQTSSRILLMIIIENLFKSYLRCVRSLAARCDADAIQVDMCPR